MENKLSELPGDNIAVTAEQPEEMVVAQKNLVDWAIKKVELEAAEMRELEGAYLHAKERKWKHSTLYNAFKKAEKRVSYYTKLKLALEAGYHIVPNFLWEQGVTGSSPVARTFFYFLSHRLIWQDYRFWFCMCWFESSWDNVFKMPVYWPYS